MHARSIRDDVPEAAEVPRLVRTHLHAPYAYPALRQQLEASAERVLRDYLADNAALFDKIEFSEKQVEVSLGDGVSIIGRIDLVRRIDTEEITIVDLKSSDRTQAEDVTETQLHVYALGYQDLTSRRPDYVETYELDERKRKRRSVDDEFIEDVWHKTRAAAAALRAECSAACAHRREVRCLRLPAAAPPQEPRDDEQERDGPKPEEAQDREEGHPLQLCTPHFLVLPIYPDTAMTRISGRMYRPRVSASYRLKNVSK